LNFKNRLSQFVHFDVLLPPSISPVYARTADGRSFRILAILDEYTRECLAILAKRHIGSQDVIEQWRKEYNNYRPHSSLDYLTPAEFARRYYEKNQEKEAMQSRQVAGSLSF
jgi:hypothetical protein